RVSDGLADPLWILGAAPTTPRQRPPARAALEAAAPAALCAGDQDCAQTTAGTGQSSRGVWHAGGHPGRAGSPWLAYQYSLCCALPERFAVLTLARCSGKG